MNQVLAVENLLRKRPLRKVFTIAWKRIYPNTEITSVHKLELLKVHKMRRIWWKFLSKLAFMIWGGERYDALKSITDHLTKTKVTIYTFIGAFCSLMLSMDFPIEFPEF